MDDFPAGELRLAARAYNLGADMHKDILPNLGQEVLQKILAVAPDEVARIQEARWQERWDIITPGYLLQPAQPPMYLIGGMLRRPSLSCVYGAPGDLKSFLLADLAVCVAGGLPWLESLPGVGMGGRYGVKQGPVLWLDMDNGPERLQERFGALLRAYGLDANAPLYAISLPRPPFDASSILDTGDLAHLVQAKGVTLCVIDNLGTASGGRDENSSQMVDVMANLRHVAAACGCAIIVIHHARKGLGSTGGREGDRLRGHSSIEASLDLALLVEREGDDITVRSTKTRDDPVRAFKARFTWEQGDNHTLQAARFFHFGLVQLTEARQGITTHEVAALLDDEEGLNQTKLCDRLQEEHGLSRTPARKLIKDTVQAGAIREVASGTGPTSAKLYYRAGSEPA